MTAIGDRGCHAQSRMRSLALEHARDKHELNGLVTRHSLAHSELASLVGVNRSKLHEIINEMLELGLIDEVHRDSNKYNYTLTHVHQVMDFLGKPSWRDAYSRTIVMAVANMKGGTGKTNTAIHLAVALGLDLELRPRILVVDFDPQGSLSSYGMTANDDETNTITAIDIALQDYEDNAYQSLKKGGYSEEDIINMALIESHIPNIHIMPALSMDQRFDACYYSLPESERPKLLRAFKEKVIDKLSGYYDIILIDTPPHINPINWSALEAANAVLTPVTPRTVDWDATCLFLRVMPECVAAYAPSQGENLEWFKVVAVNTDTQHNRDKSMLMRMKQQAGASAITNFIQRTPAFEEASKKYITVFDLLKSDSQTTSKQIDLAKDSVLAAAHEIKLDLITTFGVPIK